MPSPSEDKKRPKLGARSATHAVLPCCGYRLVYRSKSLGSYTLEFASLELATILASTPQV